MYYHCLSLKYVTYGTVFPHDDEAGDYRPAYRWLGKYCGYFPQIWLSRASVGITGYRGSLTGRWRREFKDRVLFGFDQIHGFPVDYDFWSMPLLNVVMNPDQTPAEIDDRIIARLEYGLNEMNAEEGENPDLESYSWEILWGQERPNLAEFLRKHVFVERTQVVVPSLNLKTAKRILCRNERQKKVLRQMGFIEDRIEIRQTPPDPW